MLKYIGNGHAHVGIPARDLSDQEVEELGGEAQLLATGLYATKSAGTDSKPGSPAPALSDQDDQVISSDAQINGDQPSKTKKK